jgi:hypothetical protein
VIRTRGSSLADEGGMRDSFAVNVRTIRPDRSTTLKRRLWLSLTTVVPTRRTTGALERAPF